LTIEILPFWTPSLCNAPLQSGHILAHFKVMPPRGQDNNLYNVYNLYKNSSNSCVLMQISNPLLAKYLHSFLSPVQSFASKNKDKAGLLSLVGLLGYWGFNP